MTQAGPAIPVLVSTAAPDGGPALRVAVVSDGRPTEAGPARPVVIVTDGRPTQGNEPVPVVYATGVQAGAPLAGAATPIVVVSGSLAPINTGLPVVSGTTTVGQALSATNGTWSNSPISYAYQWKRDGANIGGATANTYTLQAADANTTITVTVTATNAAGSASATSAGTAIGLVLNGLVSEYRFDNGSGTTLTDYVSGYNGTLGTGAADRPDWVAAGLDFVPGNADVVINTTMPDAGLLGAITICVVAQLDTGSAFRSFVSKCAGSGALNNPFDFRTDNSATPKLAMARANGTTLSVTTSGPNCALGAYRMYSVVSPSTIDLVPTFYVGTTPTIATGAAGSGAPTGSSANLRIGRRADGVVQMDGIMAYILIYNRALSAAEITQNYTVLQSRLASRGVALP